MTASTSTHTLTRTQRHASRATTTTLLGAGALAGPLYLVTSLTQALTRDGFDLSRHQWSMLAIGGYGWVQIANFALAGLLTIAFAGGLAAALSPGRASTWGPRLVGVYGASLVAAGAFRADPAFGFPAGTPAGPGEISWHGSLHLAAGGIGFICMAIATFVLARRFAEEGHQGWAVGSRIVGVLFVAGFSAVASGGGAPAANLAFTAAVIMLFTWMSAVAVHRYRRAGQARQ